MVKANVVNVLGLKANVVTDGLYGIEVEAEGTNLPGAVDGWRVDNDPSLQAGLESHEYVMPKPGSLEDCAKALDNLRLAYKHNKTKVLETDTSGVHVHINMQDHTIKQLFTFITTYFALETLITTYCGPMREGNHFCLRTSDAEGGLLRLIKAAKSHDFAPLNTTNIRYSTLNPLALFIYGSLEIRSMRGTGDTDAILTWVKILDNIRKAALEFKDPVDVLTSFSRDGERAFIQNILGNQAARFLEIKDCDTIVCNDVRRIQALAFSVDWSKWSDRKVNPFPKRIREAEEE